VEDVVNKTDPINEALASAIAQLTSESLSISLRDDSPWWRPAGRRLGAIPYQDWTWSDLDLCRLESRRMLTHNEFGIGGIKTRVGYIIDQGFQYSIAPLKGQFVLPTDLQKIQDYLDLVCEANAMGEIESELMLRLDRDGEVFLRVFPPEDGIVDLRFIEPERVRAGEDADTSATSPERWGIDTQPTDAKRILGYWVEPEVGLPPELIPEAEIVHIKANSDGAIPRGIPLYQPVFENLKRCEDLLTSMSVTAKARAKIALIRRVAGLNEVRAENIKSKLTTGYQPQPDGTQRQVTIDDYPYGAVIRAGANDSFEFPSSNIGSSDSIAVLQADLRAVGVLLNMPEWMFTGLADQKYSNAFVVEAPTLKSFRRIQAQIMERLATGRYRQRASLLWRALRLAADAGIISKEVLANCEIKCVPPSLEVRDKQSEASVNSTYLGNGVLDKQTVRERLGEDHAEIERRLKKEQEASQASDPTGGMGLGGIVEAFVADDGVVYVSHDGEWLNQDALQWVTEARDRSHLIRKTITNKAGRKQVVWVKPETGSGTGTGKTGADTKPEPAKEPKKSRPPVSVDNVHERLSSSTAMSDDDVDGLVEDIGSLTVKEVKQVRQKLGYKPGSGRKADLSAKLLESARAKKLSKSEAKAEPKPKPDATPTKPDSPKTEPQDPVSSVTDTIRQEGIDRPERVGRQSRLRDSLTKSGLTPGKQASVADVAKSLGISPTEAAITTADMVDRGELKYVDDKKERVTAGDKWNDEQKQREDRKKRRQEKWAKRAERVTEAIPSWMKKAADVVDSFLNPWAKESAGEDDELDYDDIREIIVRTMLDAQEEDPELLQQLKELLFTTEPEADIELSEVATESHFYGNDGTRYTSHAGEWYETLALEWVTEARDRSHLVKEKRRDKNGVMRTVYVKPKQADAQPESDSGSDDTDEEPPQARASRLIEAGVQSEEDAAKLKDALKSMSVKDIAELKKKHQLRTGGKVKQEQVDRLVEHAKKKKASTTTEPKAEEPKKTEEPKPQEKPKPTAVSAASQKIRSGQELSDKEIDDLSAELGKMSAADIATELEQIKGESMKQDLIGQYVGSAKKTKPATPQEIESKTVEVFDNLLTEKFSSLDMVPVHEIRKSIAEQLGAKSASHAELDKIMLDMRRSKKLNLISISDRSRATPEQLNDSVSAVGEIFFYAEKGPNYTKPVAPSAKPAEQPKPQPQPSEKSQRAVQRVAEAKQRVETSEPSYSSPAVRKAVIDNKALLEGLRGGNMPKESVDGALSSLEQLDGPQMFEVARALNASATLTDKTPKPKIKKQIEEMVRRVWKTSDNVNQ
jgi:hypothetical protein